MNEKESMKDLNSISRNIAASAVMGNAHSFPVENPTYVAGLILKGICTRQCCSICQSGFTADGPELHNLYTQYREWSDTSRLCYPSIDFTTLVGLAATDLETYLDKDMLRLYKCPDR